MEPKDLARIATLVFVDLFPLGQIAATRGANKALAPHVIADALNRHARCDWGELDAHDWQANEDALAHGGRLFSVYREPASGVRFYVVTEADRSVTTVLLPEEY